MKQAKFTHMMINVKQQRLGLQLLINPSCTEQCYIFKGNTPTTIETLPDLGERKRHWNNLTHPTAPRDVTKVIAKYQFIDALSDLTCAFNSLVPNL